MSDTPNPLALPADWSWQLGQRFLAGAQLCDYECTRAFVVDAGVPLTMCCDPCQLAVSVTEGLMHPDDDACCYQTYGDVLIMVDLCKIVPDEDGDWDPVDVSTKAQASSQARGAILQGLQKMLGGDYHYGGWESWLVDPIQLTCKNVDIGKWAIIDEENTCVRWALPITVKL